MDLWDVIKAILIPIAMAITGHQYMTLNSLRKSIDNKIDETRLRSILLDKEAVLRLAHEENKSRIERMEDRLDKIDVKLDKIMELLLQLK